MREANETFATRRFTFRSEDGIDHEIAKGTDLAKHKPEIPGEQLDDWHSAGLVGAKPEADKAASTPTPAASKA